MQAAHSVHDPDVARLLAPWHFRAQSAMIG
jgi:hypothetical protein